MLVPLLLPHHNINSPKHTLDFSSKGKKKGGMGLMQETLVMQYLKGAIQREE